ncbi:MAG: hypothetical protein HC851_01795 [Acaryochloris sp. RU_4_1]|nr:hypothetical protein [Acaryochloris sp. SU_5_25]NJM64475.1 hypothetical protein [Acaryochloris sp. RU_4_1]NJR53369.1 hypothetical protein [Acaryochloris sp. CRU_2_0]
MDDLELLQTFVFSFLGGRATLLSNSDLRIEPISDTLQLLAKTEGLVATAKLAGEQRFTSIRYKSSFWPQLHEAMIAQKCLPIRRSKIAGFYEYEPVEVPNHYHIRFTDSLDLLQTWWSYKKTDKPLSFMRLLIFHRDIWYPIQDLSCEQGTLTIQTSGYEMKLYPLDMLLWLQQVEQPSPALQTQKQGHPSEAGRSQQYSMHQKVMVAHYPDSKRIGDYLLDAGLLSSAQVDVVLSDQELTGMRFGEILVSRGWLKSQTIEFLFQNVILPQRTLARKALHSGRQKAVEPLTANNLETSTTHQPLPTDALKASQNQPIQPLKQLNTVPDNPPTAPVSSVPLTAANTPQPDPKQPTTPRLLSIHDRETLATYNKLNLEDLPDWLEIDSPD